jgi:ATP-dependent DNA helicase RecQ
LPRLRSLPRRHHPHSHAGVIAQKILSAIARTEQRFGVNHIIAVLRGANTDRIRQFHHDQLSTYGLLAAHSEVELRDFIYQLIGQGAIAQENLLLSNGRSAPIIKFTRDSLAVLKGQKPVRLVQIIHKSAAEARKTRGNEISWEGVDHDLFDALRALRKQLAGQRGVPPYVILSDATLRELARLRPTTMQNFRLIYGIGENKLKDLGPTFLPFIASHCQSKNLSTDLSSSPTPRPSLRIAIPGTRPALSRLSPEKLKAYELFRQGASLDDVSRHIGRARSTTADYLADFITAEKPASIAPWVPEPVYRQIQATKAQINTDRLKPLFLALGEEVPYDQIRLVVAHLAPADS